MDYEKFKESVAEKFKDYMPEKYRNMTLRVVPMKKINRVFDGITLVSEDEVIKTSPIIPINGMYEYYLETGNLQWVLQRTAVEMEKAFADMPKVDIVAFDNVKENIIFQVVNTLQNEDMLRDMPNKEFLDLSIIYRLVFKEDEDGIQSSIIHNDLAQKIGMDEEQLFKCALENTRRIFPPTVKSVNDVIRDAFMSVDIPAEVADRMTAEMPKNNMMWIISNEKGYNGAGTILYEDILHKLAADLGTDLYILPSSKHEVIAMPVEMGDPEELAKMVSGVNRSQVELEDRISNQVYIYDKSLRKVKLATDTQDKSIETYGGVEI